MIAETVTMPVAETVPPIDTVLLIETVLPAEVVMPSTTSRPTATSMPDIATAVTQQGAKAKKEKVDNEKAKVKKDNAHDAWKRNVESAISNHQKTINKMDMQLTEVHELVVPLIQENAMLKRDLAEIKELVIGLQKALISPADIAEVICDENAQVMMELSELRLCAGFTNTNNE